MDSTASPSARLQAMWRRLSPLPGGRWLFSRLFGRMVPYSGSVRPLVVQLEPGNVRVRMRDRRAVRNHLSSVHAIALANLGEATTGLAVVGALPPTARGILVGLEVAYHKKARGPLEARCRCVVPQVAAREEHEAVAQIYDAAGDVVATVTARWLVEPLPAAHGARAVRA
jgi:acyl-coenzyme A thioesterase PaaI-like protein